MKKLILLIGFVAAAWYGWHHYPELLHKAPSHQAVVENQTDHPIERLRLQVGGQTYVSEKLASGARAVFPFRVGADSPFGLSWQYGDKVGEFNWQGGFVTAGPMVQRHLLTITDDGGVTYRAEPLTNP